MATFIDKKDDGFHRKKIYAALANKTLQKIIEETINRNYTDDDGDENISYTSIPKTGIKTNRKIQKSFQLQAIRLFYL